MPPHRTEAQRRPTAVVMNLFYTGLGIARSLGEQGVPVVGLTAQRGLFGNFTRYARTVRCADSRNDPETLLRQLLGLAQELGDGSVLFPTRDHDLVFLNRFRQELEPHFALVMPSGAALERCLNKWDTYQFAVRAGVPSPKCWLIENDEDLARCAGELSYPVVLKPLEAHHWRAGENWNIVGGRKAIAVSSREELLAEYATVALAEPRVLLQEMIPGGDDCLVIAACYVDEQFELLGGFSAQKLLQSPPSFGSGCIVQSVDRPELFEPTIRLLRAIAFSGVAEVEYKWDSRDRQFKLIEINPRPWDQHRLGAACGTDLMHLAYCDRTGSPRPSSSEVFRSRKWVGEHDLLMMGLRLLWQRQPGLLALFRQARGPKIYSIWSARDPLPFVAYTAQLIGTLFRSGRQFIRRASSPAPATTHKAAVEAPR